jgi:hypothetical protein
VFCGECGTRNPDTNQFCKNCGKPLARRQQDPKPAEQPVPAPLPSPAAQPVPVTAASAAVRTPPGTPVSALRRTRNWLGIISLILGILSWGILTVNLAILSVILGIVATVLFRKATGRIGISGVLGIVLGIAALGATVALA